MSSDKATTSSDDKTTKPDPMDPLEYLSHTRACQIVHYLCRGGANSPTNDDIEQNIREIRALLVINDEIFTRCMPNIMSSSGASTTLTRFGFDVIKTRHKDSKLQIITKPERLESSFDTAPLSTLPDGFGDIIVVKFKEEPFASMIDFEDFFQKALMMHDHALKFFLPKLKDHLELVQVCLGQMDEWVQQPDKNVAFINILFEKELKIPTDIDPLKKSKKCCYCNGSVGWYDESYSCSFMKCKTVHVLTECTVPGKHDITFEVANESEQTRLQRFLYFLSG